MKNSGGAIPRLWYTIQQARVRAGLTQAELADRLGTSQAVVSRWERGRRTPTIATLAKIAEAIGATLVIDLRT